MPKVTPIFRLPYFQKGEAVTGIAERSRFLTIDRQLEAIFSFLGDGVITGWDLIQTQGVPLSITVTQGSGIVSGVASTSDGDIVLRNLAPGTSAGNSVNYIYAQLLGQTPETKKVRILATTVFQASRTFLPLGNVVIDQNNNIVSINTDESTGRKNITFIETVLSLIQDHLHTGEAGEPSKIDLQDHVKGVLSSANIPSFDASKISGGILDPKLISLSHTQLSDIGTLTHPEIDSLIEKLQNVNKLLFGDLMTSNLLQFIISMKHVFDTVDEFFPNMFTLIPGIANNTFLNPNTFIDTNATSAEVDYLNHRIRGVSLPAQEFGQVTISSVSDWESGDYDPAFIRIFETASAYGYGYGYGEGGDFFDVILTEQFDFLEGTNTQTSFAGSQIGYGVSDLYGFDFESTHAGEYAYGYGFEYGAGFPTTLTSTIVTLNPLTLSLILHDKEITGDSPGGPNEYEENVTPPVFSFPTESGLPDKDTFVREIGKQDSRRNFGGNIDPTNDGANNVPIDLNPYTSFQVSITGDDATLRSHRSAAYSTWREQNPADLSKNNFLTFNISQVANALNKDWTFDHSFELIIETTNDARTERVYFRYTPDGANPYRFLDASVEYFSDALALREVVNGINRVQISAELKTANMIFLTATDIATGNEIVPTDTTFNAERLRNFTGFILYSSAIGSEGLGHDNFITDVDGATSILFPQGQGERIIDPDLVDTSRMLADIDRVFIGGPFGFASDITNNRINDIIIAFPDPVEFTTISWIAEEPGDSIVYIQISPLDAPAYDPNNIYTNSPDRLATIPEFTNATALPSGSSFSELFSNTRGMRLRVVLLPTTDLRVAPTINSITVNYVSQTQSNTFVVNTTEDWLDAKLVDNVRVSADGKTSILLASTDEGKIKNLIYGTDRAVVEYNDDFTAVVKRYTGTDLPRTSQQILNAQTGGLSGFVTDAKKLNNGDIIIMDRDESRLIEVDRNYRLKSIYASERVFLTNNDTGGGSAGSEATLVKAVFNRQLEENGVLYLVFSHQLNAWPTVDLGGNVFPQNIFIRSKGQTLSLDTLANLNAEGTVLAVDRGIIAFTLDTTFSNFIEGSSNPVLETYLDRSLGQNGVEFTSATETTDGKLEVPITKVGTKGTFTDENIIFAPIQGIMAFDVDPDDNYIILKRTRPYEWDNSPADIGTSDGIWYARVTSDRMWKTWAVGTDLSDPNIETNLNTIEDTDADPSLIDPDFFINNFFGYKGSIQRLFEWLLITFCGDKKVWITKKESNGIFRRPTEITLPSDGTTPMAARLDPITTTEDDFDFVYLALSDLRRGTTNESGRSRILKIEAGLAEDDQLVWRWGSGSDANEFSRPTSAVSVNDVRPLEDTTEEGVIAST